MSVVDVLAAVIAHLKTVTEVTDLVSTRVYGGEIPDSEVESMPQKLVVLRLAGGLEELRSHRLTQARIDVFSYGEGYLEAGRVDRAVAEALHDLRRVDVSSTFLHSAGYDGPRQLKEPTHGWPFVSRTAVVRYDERATA